MPFGIMDPLTALILGGAYLSKEAVADAAKRMLGPYWDTIGERIKNRIVGPHAPVVIVDAAHALITAGLQPQPVPGRILLQLTDHASVEEDDELRRKWVALLANSASPGESNKILPSFVDILRHLTPQQAQLLDWMYAQKIKPPDRQWFPTWPDFRRDDIEKRFEMSSADFALFITDLDRLQLIEPRRTLSIKEKVPTKTQLTIIIDWINGRVLYDVIVLTALGLRFIEACTPPQSVSSTGL